MIMYNCPRCKAALTAFDDKGGTKTECTTCGQRLQIPLPREMLTPNKTILGESIPITLTAMAEPFPATQASPPSPAEAAAHSPPPASPPPPPANLPPMARQHDAGDELDSGHEVRRRQRSRYLDEDELEDRYERRESRRQDGPSGFSVAGMVLGIIASCMFCLWFIAIPSGVVGLILSNIGMSKDRKGQRGFAVAGLVCSLVGLALSCMFFILFAAMVDG